MASVASSLSPTPLDELPAWPPGRTWGLATDVAVALSCHPRTVHKMRAAGLLPARPHGVRSWRYHREEILRLVRAGEVLPDGAPPSAQDARSALQRALGLLDGLAPAELEQVASEALRQLTRELQAVRRLLQDDRERTIARRGAALRREKGPA